MKYQSIVFSGLPGAGKSTLVKKISEIYGWPVHSLGDIWRQRWIKSYPNREVVFEDYWSKTSHEDLVQINIDAREIFAKSRIIGDSRYTIYLRDLPIFLVFLSAGLDVRATRAFGLEKYGGKSIEEIKQILMRRENDEVRVGKELFGYDYRDSYYYDLVVNSGRLSREEEIAVIKGIIQNGNGN
jgi:cytidylate kinase